MSKYVCPICGYVYDDAVEKVPFDQLPGDWVCPLCGAAKAMFERQEEAPAPAAQPAPAPQPAPAALPEEDELRELSAGTLSALCSNLARGCEKQYRMEEAGLFTQLAQYYASKAQQPVDADVRTLSAQLTAEGGPLAAAKTAAAQASDRGAARVLVWSEKVTRVLQSLLTRYAKEGAALLDGTRIWVCDICGFVYVGQTPPAVCPVCKVPSFKILEVK